MDRPHFIVSLLMQSFAWESHIPASKWEFHIETLSKFYLLQLVTLGSPFL